MFCAFVFLFREFIHPAVGGGGIREFSAQSRGSVLASFAKLIPRTYFMFSPPQAERTTPLLSTRIN